MRPRTAEEKQELNSAVDEAAVRIFKTEFSKSSLTSDPSSSDNGAQQVDSPSAQRSRWQSCFPCAKGYVRYPRPRFTNAGVLQVRENDVRMKKFNKKMGLVGFRSVWFWLLFGPLVL
ncbi:unnamed protein product [Heligmosomoides polygyrus]|uniref:TORC_N domain-containing protein n=1 Tax=Heligmosomoides polygyrus TaxID=6339 RepID=A0A183FRZ1_HELPZ|nr:unnamed protein product [Heligmosomoides polygyrus]